jgi:hypothetical protein
MTFAEDSTDGVGMGDSAAAKEVLPEQVIWTTHRQNMRSPKVRFRPLP